jgi:aromatic ring-opening dioxygenase LigB subunit
LLLGKNEPTPVPHSRAACAEMERELRAARPDSIAVLTPHGIYRDGKISLGVTPYAQGELDGVEVSVATDRDLAAAWAYRAASRGVPVAPLASREPEGTLSLDWGVVIPLALLAANLAPVPAVVVACPARDVAREHLIAWGEALAEAADERQERVALIVSADQGHGHAADGPYGFTPESARYDQAMVEAVQADDLPRLLQWDENFAEDALADSYWQTLALIGVQKRVPLRARFLSYEIDHYFGLLCASFAVGGQG